MRLGILGGTFDPPHVGHLLAAVDAFEALGLDRLVLVPAATQPLKALQAGASAAPAADRLAMVRLLAADDPRFEVDPIEIRREGLSYSVDTLAAFAERFPAAERFFLVGADVLHTFAQWREPARVLRLAQLVVLRRAVQAGPEADGGGAAALGVEGPAPRFVATRRVDVSSTEVRARVRAGQSIRGFVPEAIAAYIGRAGLYR